MVLLNRNHNHRLRLLRAESRGVFSMLLRTADCSCSIASRRCSWCFVSAGALTNGDIDHFAGLLFLREKTGFDVYAIGEIIGGLSVNPLFGVLDPDLVVQKKMQIGTAFRASGWPEYHPAQRPRKSAALSRDRRRRYRTDQ